MSKINIKEIKEQYPSLKVWSDNHAAELYRRIQEHQLIKEFLYTVSIPKTIEHLKKQFSVEAEPDNDNQAIIIHFEEVMTDKRIHNINEFMDKFGYYPSAILGIGSYKPNIKKIMGRSHAQIVYEAKYDEEKLITGPYLYHLTPDISWVKIKNIGLTPKTHSKIANHPGRIYVLTNIDNLGDFGIDGIEDIGFMLWNNSKTKDRVKDVYLLRIDVSKLPKDIKFFKDPNFMVGDAVWTYRNIPPNAIEIIKKMSTSEF